jgi:hypothetical protein
VSACAPTLFFNEEVDQITWQQGDEEVVVNGQPTTVKTSVELTTNAPAARVRVLLGDATTVPPWGQVSVLVVVKN